MKIVHIITGLNDGGAEAVLYRLCYYDRENEHICISLMDEGKYGQLLNKNGVKVYCLNFSSNRISLLGLRRLFKILRKSKPDVVQTWMYHADFLGGVIARIAGIKNVIWGVHHTNLTRGETKFSTILIARINVVLSKFIPRKIIYCAQKARQVQESIGYNREIGVVVNNGYNLNDFYPNLDIRFKFRQELSLDDSVTIVGHVGRYSPYKDYPNLISSFGLLSKENKTTKFVLVGTGLDETNIELCKLVESANLKDKVIMLGRREDINYIMNGIDLFVLSSSTEAFPNVLNEAMACSTPCITTDVGDARHIIGEAGWVVKSRDSVGLAKAMSIAIYEKDNLFQVWMNRKSECRNHIVNNFSIEKMISSYKEIWSE